MPEHDVTIEERWLAQNYHTLGAYRDRWVAVLGEEIVADDVDHYELVVAVRRQRGPDAYSRALYAYVDPGPTDS